MKISKLTIVCLCLGLTQFVWSQDQHLDPGRQAPGVAGYLDPRTGTFSAKAQSSNASPDTSVTLTTIVARLIFVFDITANDQPTSAVTSCTVNLSTSDYDTGLSYQESATSVATANGTACTVTVLFDWPLASPTMDQISVAYEIDSSQAVTVGTAAPVAVKIRTAHHSLPPLTMPTYGQTITEPTIDTYI